MDDRPLTASHRDRRFGRRAGDIALKGKFYAAAFVAQVAGLSLPREAGPARYDIGEPLLRKGLVRDEKV